MGPLFSPLSKETGLVKSPNYTKYTLLPATPPHLKSLKEYQFPGWGEDANWRNQEKIKFFYIRKGSQLLRQERDSMWEELVVTSQQGWRGYSWNERNFRIWKGLHWPQCIVSLSFISLHILQWKLPCSFKETKMPGSSSNIQKTKPLEMGALTLEWSTMKKKFLLSNGGWNWNDTVFFFF